VGSLPNFGENNACLLEDMSAKEQLLEGAKSNADSPTLSISPEFARIEVWWRTPLLR